MSSNTIDRDFAGTNSFRNLNGKLVGIGIQDSRGDTIETRRILRGIDIEIQPSQCDYYTGTPPLGRKIHQNGGGQEYKLSFSWSLRHQLRDTPVKVFEIVPPIVDTKLDQGARERRGQTDKGIQPQEVADQTLAAMATDTYEIAVGMAQNLMKTARSEQAEMFFGRMNS